MSASNPVASSEGEEEGGRKSEKNWGAKHHGKGLERIAFSFPPPPPLPLLRSDWVRGRQLIFCVRSSIETTKYFLFFLYSWSYGIVLYEIFTLGNI